jgi:hypothetical protein
MDPHTPPPDPSRIQTPDPTCVAAPPAPRFARARHLLRRLAGIRRPDLLVARRIGRLLPDRLYLALGHLFYFGRWPNYTHPRSLNEHIHAYMLRCRSPLLHIAADKLATREHVARVLGEQYLVPLIGAWDSADTVPLKTLPRPCVVKTTVGSGQVWFLKPGVYTDLCELRQHLRRWLATDFSSLSREWCYRGLPNRVIAEEMLVGEAGAQGAEQAEGALPADYKFYVIGGAVRFIQVDRGRFAAHTRNLYDTGWRLLEERLTLENHPADPRPPRLQEMIDLTQRLAEPFEFLRVDWYVVGERIYIGELTNYPGAGFERFIPPSYALELGSHWRVPAEVAEVAEAANAPASAEAARGRNVSQAGRS